MTTPSVTVDVHSSDGRPVAGARVWFSRAPVAVPDIAALTGEDGRAVLVAPAAGRYEVSIGTDVGTTTRWVRVSTAPVGVAVVVEAG